MLLNSQIRNQYLHCNKIILITPVLLLNKILVSVHFFFCTTNSRFNFCRFFLIPFCLFQLVFSTLIAISSCGRLEPQYLPPRPGGGGGGGFGGGNGGLGGGNGGLGGGSGKT